MNIRKFFLLVLIFLFSTDIYAGIRPSFSLDFSAWNATDIVIATEGNVIDGNFTVIETLKGDLLSGEAVSIPELASFRSKSSRLVRPPFFLPQENVRRYVSGSRMILFLKRVPQSANANTSVRWEAASLFGGMNVSVVWIEGEQSFAFMQLINPGASLLVEYGKSEKELRERTSEVIQLRNSLNAAIAIPEKSRRAEALVSFATSDFYLASQAAFDELPKCGDDALPVLRKILNDNSKLRFHDDVIASMTVIGGKSIGPELTEIVKGELLYWKANAPGLKDGWWNQINDPEGEILRGHYIKLYRSLVSLKTLRFAEAKDAVADLRDFWRSLPQLEDKSGLDQMSKECDDFLLQISQ